MSGKHSKVKEKTKAFKLCYLIMIFFTLILLVFIVYKTLYIMKEKPKKEQEIVNVSDEITIENEKLVLKSNFEEDREKKIIYIFQDNILTEVKVLEIYHNIEDYNVQKEENINKTGIEIIENNDSELKIFYKRLKLGNDEGLSYQEIYDKYMGMVGAYEIISE